MFASGSSILGFWIPDLDKLAQGGYLSKGTGTPGTAATEQPTVSEDK